MKTVGVRELKNRLSEYLRQARSGESVLVTDRGQLVAELTPPGHGATDASVPAGLRSRQAEREELRRGAAANRRHDVLLPLMQVRHRRGGREPVHLDGAQQRA